MTKLLWVLGAALVALVITRIALRWRRGTSSPLHALARGYLIEQLAAQGIADKVPSRCITEIVEHCAGAVVSRPLGRIAAASQCMRRIDETVAVIARWVREGRKIPRSIAQLPLPGFADTGDLKLLDTNGPDA